MVRATEFERRGGKYDQTYANDCFRSVAAPCDVMLGTAGPGSRSKPREGLAAFGAQGGQDSRPSGPSGTGRSRGRKPPSENVNGRRPGRVAEAPTVWPRAERRARGIDRRRRPMISEFGRPGISRVTVSDGQAGAGAGSNPLVAGRRQSRVPTGVGITASSLWMGRQIIETGRMGQSSSRVRTTGNSPYDPQRTCGSLTRGLRSTVSNDGRAAADAGRRACGRGRTHFNSDLLVFRGWNTCTCRRYAAPGLKTHE